jgi:micrococcal nuclease
VSYQYDHCKVVRWIDGDTVELTIDLGFHLSYTSHFRLEGVDTPERGRAGYATARDFCNAWAPPGTEVVGVTSKDDKYGRFLIYLKGEVGPSINAQLLEAGLALSYNGGAKHAS